MAKQNRYQKLLTMLKNYETKTSIPRDKLGDEFIKFFEMMEGSVDAEETLLNFLRWSVFEGEHIKESVCNIARQRERKRA